MGNDRPTTIYTLTDESPLLATCSMLPILRVFTEAAGIRIRKSDLSLSARILAEFSDYLQPGQRVEDCLAELGRLTQVPDSNIIKLPNISASVPQLVAAIAELQARGLAVPGYPEEPHSDTEHQVRARESHTPAVFWLDQYRGHDAELAAQFAPLASTLSEQEEKIIDELCSVQGSRSTSAAISSPTTPRPRP